MNTFLDPLSNRSISHNYYFFSNSLNASGRPFQSVRVLRLSSFNFITIIIGRTPFDWDLIDIGGTMGEIDVLDHIPDWSRSRKNTRNMPFSPGSRLYW
jgi:hypothetical protein